MQDPSGDTPLGLNRTITLQSRPKRRGVEQAGQLVGLITRRSQVQILPPLRRTPRSTTWGFGVWYGVRQSCLTRVKRRSRELGSFRRGGSLDLSSEVRRTR